MRDPIIDPETGERIPFSDFKDFRKVMYLARTTGDGSDFQCVTRGGKITEWNDPRPQPTYDEIEAVADELVAEQEEMEKEDNFSIDAALLKLAKATFRQENRLRVLEGKTEITFRQFVKAVKAL